MEIKTREDFEKLKKLPFFKGVIKTDSMEPLIRVGDRIIVEVGNNQIDRFDIIVFWSDPRNELICHYLWAVNRIVSPLLYQTRSIRYGERDHPIREADYLGKVVSHKLSLRIKIRILFSYLLGRRD